MKFSNFHRQPAIQSALVVPAFRSVILAILAWIGLGLAEKGAFALAPNQVLVLYNSQNADSLGVYNYYSANRPGVLGLDLNDASLSPGTISHANFASKIRNPLRAHLSAQSLSSQVVVFVLTKGLPHRISDMNNASVGDNPGAAASLISAGKATYASVDSELTLLWQDLNSGESGGAMDSKADNNIENPYFSDSSAITSYSRSNITNSKKWEQLSGFHWRMKDTNNGPPSSPGNIYLTSRLDGNSLQAVEGLIDRGLIACYDTATDHIIQDKNAAGTIDGGDYLITEIIMSSWPAFTYEQTNTFLIGQNGDLTAGNAGTQRFTGNVAALTGYGGNHGGSSQSVYINTFAGQLCPGAIFNSYESFNGRKFGGVGGYGDQGQLSEWVDAGGTFGIGNTWEPLASGVAKNYAVLDHFFLEGRSWVEAAWSGVRYLSWQNLVLGDPLAVASFGNCPEPPPPTPSVSITADGSLCETSSATAVVTISVDQTSTTPTNVELDFSGADLGTDFTTSGGVSDSVVLPANQSEVSFTLTAVKDSIPEGEETLSIAVTPGSGYVEPSAPVSVPIEDSGFGSWQLAQFGDDATTAIADPGNDADKDGLLNLMEYAIGSDPNGTVSGGEPPSMWTEYDETLSEDVIVFRYRRILANDDMIYAIQKSTGLGNWNNVPDNQVSIDSQYEWREARVPKSGVIRNFLRLKVVLN